MSLWSRRFPEDSFSAWLFAIALHVRVSCRLSQAELLMGAIVELRCTIRTEYRLATAEVLEKPRLQYHLSVNLGEL